MSNLFIRCSMLPGWVDCARRAAAKQYRKMVEGFGFVLRQLQPSVGAAVGTAVHRAAAELMRRKRDGNPATAGVLETAIAAFHEEIAPGAIWDDTTPNTLTARAQIERLTAAYLPVVEEREPVLIEEPFKATVGGGWTLTGQIDLYDAQNELDDLKTGALARPYIQQVGGYTMLLEANGHEVKKAGTTFLKRARVAKPQPAPVRTYFDLEPARRSAWAVIQEIRRDMEAFAEKGDPYKLPANPMSLMCSEKYCPAWGTEFCKVHLKG